jgi:hypothetical protein
MTKWICKGHGCATPCKSETGDQVRRPTGCLLNNGTSCWSRDCTEEKKRPSIIDRTSEDCSNWRDEFFRSIDEFLVKKDDLKITDKNILDVLQSMNRRIAYSDKKVQELERELKNHYHDTGFPK